MPQIEAGMRTRISEFLPRAIETALCSYQLFSEQGISEDAKEFKAHHDACKVAIAHVELLIKLAQWADLPDPTLEEGCNQMMLRSMIENARGELAEYGGGDE